MIQKPARGKLFQIVKISDLNPIFLKLSQYWESLIEMILFQVSSKEAEFLQKILPGLYKNLQQNPQTLLTKYYGMFTYQVPINMHL